MISIGSHADVSVRAHCQKCDALDAEFVSRTNFEVPDLSGQTVGRTESDRRFEYWRVGGNLLQGGQDVSELGALASCATKKHESVAGALGQIVKLTRFPAGGSNRDSVR